MGGILVTGISAAVFAVWLYLLLFRGGFWLARVRLDDEPAPLAEWPSVIALVPARNEAPVIGECVSRLIAQDYPGNFMIVVIDDHSDDGTADAVAEAASEEGGPPTPLDLVRAQPLERGWAGKMWALSQGRAHAKASLPEPKYYWLTDADIAHEPDNLRRLVAKAERDRLALVSQMVRLAASGFWAGFLIPAFVLFFQKLYPFAWVNSRRRRTAAAAGGSILVRANVFDRIGGFASLRDALIDDCALARAVKSSRRDNRIWLGLTNAAWSLRVYDGLEGVWRMVARTAFTQLRYSKGLLVLTLAGMALVYCAAPLLLLAAAVSGQALALLFAFLTWLMMAIAFAPILHYYRRPLVLAFLLPLAGLLYGLMTLDSARAYGRGEGGAWKGRSLAVTGGNRRAPL